MEDREFAREFLASVPQPIIAIHPGSGSHKKNWPLENWIDLFSPDSRFADLEGLVVISGEADKAQTDQLEREWKNRDVRFARNLPLPRLAAVLERSTFIGHDSGISHLAAAAGANCVLLFGPTDPDVWAPKNENVRVLRPPSGKLDDLEDRDRRSSSRRRTVAVKPRRSPGRAGSPLRAVAFYNSRERRARSDAPYQNRLAAI